MNLGLTFKHLLLATASLVLTVGLSAAENPRSAETFSAALNDAHALIANRANFQVVRVEGDSMLPFFGNGAVLVVKQMPAVKLKVGMVVVYTNRFHETVAHRLVSRSEAGWQIQGYNNTKADSTLVSDANLLGVVYATFHSDGMMDASMLASISNGTTLALAAPAR
ncbi:MAG TPA: S24/S26 family peptidase [Rariglobus sp.]|jgi:signal peptidase I|nr:S24/S26 family peptidase [Rariglobus sp.]